MEYFMTEKREVKNKQTHVVEEENVAKLLEEILKDELERKKRIYKIAFVVGVLITIVLASLWTWGAWLVLLSPIMGFPQLPFVAIFMQVIFTYIFIFMMYELAKLARK